MKMRLKRIVVLFLSLIMVLTMQGFGEIGAKAASSKVKVARPTISARVRNRDVIITINETENASGYRIYTKGEGGDHYTQVWTIKQDGTQKRHVTLYGMDYGTFYIKVKAFNGKVKSKASKAQKVTVTEKTADTVVLFTSDVHCGVDKGFTYAGLKAVRDKLVKDGNYVLLVDNGDSIQGETIGTLSKGEAITDLMNVVGYDLAIPGNHEFDYGMEKFLELTEKSFFPYISCNFNKEGKLVFKPYYMFELGDMKIAFIGVTTPTTPTSSTPRYFQNEKGEFIYGFMQDESGQALYDAFQNAVDQARNAGADYCIGMGHLGNETECKPWTYVDLISNTTGIDAFLDGHSHDTDKALVLNKNGDVVVRQAVGTKLANIGWLRISKDGKIDTGLYTWNNDDSAIDLLGIDNSMTKALDEKLKSTEEARKTVVATTSVELTINDPTAKDASGAPIRIVRSAETNLGDLCADAYRDQSGADVAIVNGGGIRASIPAGDITLDSILRVHPYGNMLTVLEVTGQQIQDALEWGCRAVPESLGGFPQVSGMTFEIHTDIPSSCVSTEDGMFNGVKGEYRVKNIRINGEPIDLKKTYTIASHDYMLLNNGDGYTMFNGAKVLQQSVKLDNQVLIDYISDTLGGFIGKEYSDPYGTGRIVAVE